MENLLDAFQLDREIDLDIILNRWLEGTWLTDRVRKRAKKLGYTLDFHRHDKERPGYITIIDDLGKDKPRRWVYAYVPDTVSIFDADLCVDG